MADPRAAVGSARRGRVLCRAIVTADRDARFLVLHGEAGWSLPAVETRAGNWYDVRQFVDALRSEHGLNVFVRRCVAGSDNVRPSRARAYVCEALEPPASKHRWLGRDEAHLVADDAQRDALEAFLRAPPAPEPWSREGWLAEVRAFVAAATAPAKPVLRQLRTWQRSCVLSVDAGSTRLIFKAAPPAYAQEPALTGWLAGRFPWRFPAVRAFDSARGWMLLEKLEGERLDQVQSLEPWRRALESFACIQRECVGATQELLDLGAPDLRIAVLREQTTELLADREAMLPGHPDGLSEPEIAALSASGGTLDRLWDELELAGVPASFEHGDFRPEHVVVRPGAHAFFDVSNGAVSHPFFSAVTMLDFEPLPRQAGSPAAVRGALRAAYLKPWAETHAEAELAAAFETARPLAILHAALTRHRLLPYLEPRADWAFMIPYWLRKLQRCLGGVPDEAEEATR